jgi:two-component system, NarL family, response regulator DevR
MRDAPTAKPIRVFIVEDLRLMVEGLASLISEQDDMQVVGVASTVAEAVQTVGAARPHVVLMDSILPDGSGAEATVRIRAAHPAIAVLYLSADAPERGMAIAIQAGACGYVSKAASVEELLAAIRRAGGAAQERDAH